MQLLNYSLAAAIYIYGYILPGDVCLNPGPMNNHSNISFPLGFKFWCSQFSRSIGGTLITGICNFDLRLGENGLRIGHWNVNYLTSETFDQIYLFLTKSGRSHIDVLFLNLPVRIIHRSNSLRQILQKKDIQRTWFLAHGVPNGWTQNMLP